MKIECNAAVLRVSLPWQKIKDEVLGKRFGVSIALVRASEMRRIRRILRLQKKYRYGSRHALNVFSFRFDAGSGEVFLNKDVIAKEAKAAGISMSERILYLYIHALLHLRGCDHKRRRDAKLMERQENKLMRIFCK